MPGQEAKYQQVIDWVKQNIENGTFRKGDRLMSENEMSEHFGLSRQTIRRATGELENQKLVTRVRGSGTYIGDGIPTERTVSVMPAVREAHRNIAVISTFNESYIFPAILKGIGSVMTREGYSMQVTFTDNRLYLEEAILRLILEKDDIDGLIVEPVKSALPNPNIRYYQQIQERGIPVMFFNAFYPELQVPCVRIDDARAAFQATQILLDAGHEKIGAIFKSDDGQGPLRYKGYMEAMKQGGARADQESVVWLDSPASAAMERIADYVFGRLSGCTGIVCYNDLIAYDLIQLAMDRGMHIPEDLSVVGIDDSYLAGVCKVPFSSVVHPKERLGELAARNLVRLIREPGFEAGCLMETQPVLRESVAQIEHKSQRGTVKINP